MSYPRPALSFLVCTLVGLIACADKDDDDDDATHLGSGGGSGGTTSGGTSGSTTGGTTSGSTTGGSTTGGSTTGGTTTGDWTTLSGEVSVQYSEDGVTQCDSVTALAGTAYTGDCDDCTFAFEITPTVTSDDSTADCNQPYQWSFTGGWEGYTDQFLAFWETADYYGYDYDNVLAWGYGIDYAGPHYNYYYPGPYWVWLTYEGTNYSSAPDTQARLTGNRFTWSSDVSGATYIDNYQGLDCGIYDNYEANSHQGGEWTETDDLPCDGSSGYDWYYSVDVWSLATVPGETVSVTVDTTSSSTAFDPHMWINDGSSCALAYADDSFDCTYPPPKYSCPSASFTAADVAYEVVVASYGSCAGALGEYSLSIDHARDPRLRLVGDDADRYSAAQYELHVSGDATLSE